MAKGLFYLFIVLSAINLIIFGIQTVPKTRAEVAGMDAYELENDYDFEKAVEEVVEDCIVYEQTISC